MGPIELDKLQYIGNTPHKYVHIDMKLNFMHILADQDSVEYPLQIGTRKTNMPYNIYIKGYTYKVFQEPNQIQFGQKHQVNLEESTPECDTKLLSKLYQNPNQHMIEEKSKGIKSNNTREIRYQIEASIPIEGYYLKASSKRKTRSKVSKLPQEMLIETNIYGGDTKFQLIPIEGTQARPMSI